MKADTILKSAESGRDGVTRFLQELIRIPSLSGGEQLVVQRIGEEMQRVGFDQVRVDGLGNVIGRLGSGRRILAMDAHIDTVDVGNPDNWKTDPFAAVEKNGVVYGRGACDMKGAMAALVYGAKLIKELALAQDLTLILVTEGNLLKLDAALSCRNSDCVRRVGHIIGPIQHFEAAPRTSSRAFHGPGRVGKLFEGAVDH